MRRVGSYIISLFKEWIIIGRPWFGWSREWQYHMDTARDNAGRLVEHANNAAASSWPAVAGPDIPWFLPLAHNLSKVERYTSKHGEISTKRVLLHVYTTLFFFGGIWGGGYLYYGMCSKFCGIGRGNIGLCRYCTRSCTDMYAIAYPIQGIFWQHDSSWSSKTESLWGKIRRLYCFMFADGFVWLSETPEGLQEQFEKTLRSTSRTY